MGKKVLITGSEGFIGSHLTEELLNSGYDVRCLVQYNSFGNCGWLDTLPEVKKNSEVIMGDVRDHKFTESLVKGSELVFHLAALIAIPYSYIAPESYIETNANGTLNILNACMSNDVGNVIIASTSEVYGTAQYVPIDEQHPMRAQSPYAASKIAADALALSFHRSFGLPVTIVRPFNTYGPRQSARAVIPTIITQLLLGSSNLKLGSIKPSRDLVFVKDTAKGFVKAAECKSLTGEEVNISTGVEISIEDLAEKIAGLMDAKMKIVKDKKRVRPAGSEVDRLLGSSAKLKKHTKWVPETDLDTGLKKTIEWFKSKGISEHSDPEKFML